MTQTVEQGNKKGGEEQSIKEKLAKLSGVLSPEAIAQIGVIAAKGQAAEKVKHLDTNDFLANASKLIHIIATDFDKADGKQDGIIAGDVMKAKLEAISKALGFGIGKEPARPTVLDVKEIKIPVAEFEKDLKKAAVGIVEAAKAEVEGHGLRSDTAPKTVKGVVERR